MKPLIFEDVGEALVPGDVASFADLHDHVDANEYVIEAREALGPPPVFVTTADADRDGDACDLVTAWLAAGPPTVRTRPRPTGTDVPRTFPERTTPGSDQLGGPRANAHSSRPPTRPP